MQQTPASSGLNLHVHTQRKTAVLVALWAVALCLVRRPAITGVGCRPSKQVRRIRLFGSVINEYQQVV
jgi:hypothetical protein